MNNTNSRKAPSPGSAKPTYASVARRSPASGGGSHFRPEPMRQPWPGCTLEQYTTYVANYRVYLAALNTFRAEFWETASAASRGDKRKEMRVNPSDLDSPIIFRVETDINPAVNGVFSTLEMAQNHIMTRVPEDSDLAKCKIVKDIQPVKAQPCWIRKSDSPPPPYVPKPFEVEAAKERKRAARRRQRASRSLRDREAALAAAGLKDKLMKQELETAKSTKRLADWVTVQHHKNKSKLPVPKLKTGVNASVAPVARPAWYPVTKEQAAALAKQWGSAKK